MNARAPLSLVSRPALIALASLALSALAACGASEGTAPPPKWLAPVDEQGAKGVRSGTKAEELFPLEDGMVYQYVTENELGDAGLLVARVFRSDSFHGELRFPGGTRKRFSYSPDGVMIDALDSATYLLKLPLLQPGPGWRGEHGGPTHIAELGVSVEVPAGHYESCVRAVEERGGDRPTRYATTFCPGIGIVMLEAASGVNYERASLKSYAAPIPVRQDGLDVIRGGDGAPQASPFPSAAPPK